MHTKKLNKLNSKTSMALAFVLAFAALGAYKVLSSSAAQPTSIVYADYRRFSEVNSTSVKVVDEVNDYGTPTKVLQLFPGGTLNYDPPGPTFPVDIKTCYVMRTEINEGNKAATVEIGGYGTTRRITMLPTLYYREFCVESGTENGFSFNVKHVGGNGSVKVLHASHYFAIPVEYQIIGHGDKWACERVYEFLHCDGSLYIQKPRHPETAKYVTVTYNTLIEGNLEPLRTAQFPLNANITLHGNQAVIMYVQ